jgi:hypothetical protein
MADEQWEALQRWRANVRAANGETKPSSKRGAKVSNGSENNPKPRRNNDNRSDRQGPSERVSRPRSVVSWSDVTAASIAQFVAAVTDAGSACILGRTSDGGALSITVLSGNERFREWPHTAEEATEVLDYLASEYGTGGSGDAA